MKITCVLVTFNRIEKLKKALDSYQKQKVLPDRMIIIDNHSTDGTVEFLEEWKKQNNLFKTDIIFLPENTGGSGGFHFGIKKALETDGDWIYISDDDAYLQNDVLEKITKHAMDVGQNVGAICGKVEENNSLGYFHRRKIKEKLFSLKELNLKDEDYRKDSVELSTYSFVGTALRTDAIWNIGLPNKDFFLWYDDTEHGIRMGKRYKIMLFPDVVIHHDVDASNSGISWKKYYGYRNKLLTLKYNYSKVYYNSEVLLLKISMVRDLIVKKRHPLIKMKREAILDASKNKLGISNIYYPGAKI